MKCFTVSETVSEGISVQLQDGEAYIPVGSERFPTSKIVRDGLENILAKARAMLQEDTDLTDKQRRYLEELTENNRAVLQYAELSTDSKRIHRSEAFQSRVALVLVNTAPGLNGDLRYTTRVYREQQESDDGPVFKLYDDTWPAVGVHELCSDGVQKLLVLSPYSGFRIIRSGDLEDAPPILMISWKGHGQLLLQTYRPRVWRRKRHPRAA